VTENIFLKSEDVMHNKIKKSIIRGLALGVMFCLLPALSWATLAVQTNIASGHITHKYSNNDVKLDDGKTYRPSRAGLNIDLSVGEPVTLRYMVEESKNIYFEFVAGLNSLKELVPELPLTDDSPK
jgi:hypothetical protein